MGKSMETNPVTAKNDKGATNVSAIQQEFLLPI